MVLNQSLKKIVCVMVLTMLVFVAVPAANCNASYTGAPVIEFIQSVQDMSQSEREWVRDNILNPLMSDSSLVATKAQELKNQFPSIDISTADVELALSAFADTDSTIQNKVINHLIEGKQSVAYTAGSFDSIKNKIVANVSSLDNFISGLLLLQDITGLDPLFVDENADEGTLEIKELITGEMVGGDDILEQLDEIIQSISGVHFASLNLVLVGYTGLLNSVGTATERINFEKFLFDYGMSSSRHLYEGKNAKTSNNGSSNTPTPGTPALEDNDVIEKVSNVSADANGNVNISSEQTAQIIQNIAALANAAAQNANAKTKLVINVQTQSGLVQSDVSIPSAIVSEAVAKNIDFIEVATPVAEITVPSVALQAVGATSVDIKAKLVDKATELTDQQKAIVGDNLVYDFSVTAVTSSGNTSIRTFDPGIQIVIPYTLKAGESAENITVFYLDENGVPKNMQGIYNPANGTVTFDTTHLSKYYVKANNVVFNDLAKYEWARTYIESMAAKGIISGKDKDLYGPGDKITRAEFAALLVKLFKIKDSGKALTFKDVNEKAWYYSSVASAVEQGIITGKNADTFAPNDNLSRQDMAVMIGRALKKYKNTVSDKNVKLSFADTGSISDYAKDGIAVAVKYQILKGNADNTFKPLSNATRAEAAVVIYKIFNLK